MTINHEEKGFFSIVFVLIIAAVATILLLKFRSNLQSPVNTNIKSSSIIPEERLKELEAQVKIPTIFAAINKDGNIIVGDFKTKKENVVAFVKTKNLFGSPRLITVSPNKNYLTYVTFPEAKAQQYKKDNTTLELGDWLAIVDDWELHLVDLTDISKPKDSIIDNQFKIKREEDQLVQDIFWALDSSGIYYRKMTNDSEGNAFFYNVTSYDTTSGAFLPIPGKYYCPISFNGKTYMSCWDIYDLEGNTTTSIEPLDTYNRQSDDYLHPNPHSVFLSREVVTYGEPTQCILEYIDIANNNIVTELDKRKCTDGKFESMKVSPNGKNLIVYVEKDAGNSHPSEMEAINLETGEKKIFGQQSWQYNFADIYWVSDNELLLEPNGGGTEADGNKGQKYILNIDTGEIQTSDFFKDLDVQETR